MNELSSNIVQLGEKEIEEFLMFGARYFSKCPELAAVTNSSGKKTKRSNTTVSKSIVPFDMIFGFFYIA